MAQDIWKKGELERTTAKKYSGTDSGKEQSRSSPRDTSRDASFSTKSSYEPKPSRKNYDDDMPSSGSRTLWWVVGGFILALALYFFIVSPAIKGYQIYSALQAQGINDTYVTDMTSLMKEKVTAENEAATLRNKVSAVNADLSSCNQDISTAKSDAASQQKKDAELIKSLGADVNNANSAAKDCLAKSEQKDQTVVDAARRICCVQKLLQNPSIDGYDVVDGRINCVAGNGTSITC